MGRYVDLAKEIEADVGCGEPAHELNEFDEKRIGGGAEPVQPETGDEARWGDLAPIVEWFLGSTPPAEPFQLKPGITILDPHCWWQSIDTDVRAGPNGPRARYGALQDDLRRLHGLFAGRNAPTVLHS